MYRIILYVRLNQTPAPNCRPANEKNVWELVPDHFHESSSSLNATFPPCIAIHHHARCRSKHAGTSFMRRRAQSFARFAHRRQRHQPSPRAPRQGRLCNLHPVTPISPIVKTLWRSSPRARPATWLLSKRCCEETRAC